MSCQNHVSRRRFLHGMAFSAAGAMGLPALVPASALGRAGATAPSNRVALGLVSTTGMIPFRGIREFSSQPDARLVAVCDADPHRAERIQRLVDRAQANSSQSRPASGCTVYRRLDELAARPDVDALVIAALDTCGARAAIAAARAGKDVFYEHPLSCAIADGRALCDAARSHGRVFQTAAHGFPSPVDRQLYELVRSGRIGPLRTMVIRASDGVGALAALDLAQWLNGTQGIGPVEIESRPAAGFRVDYRYANGVTLEVGHGRPAIRLEGSDGWIAYTGRGGLIEASSPLLALGLDAGDRAKNDFRISTPASPSPRPSPTRGEGDCFSADGTYLPADGPHRWFLDCVKSRKLGSPSMETVHRTATLVNLGGIAMRLGGRLQWNPYAERFHDQPEADALRSSRASVWMV